MSDEKKQKEDLLERISKLYDEREREEGLKKLSELVCEEKMRAEYLYNSFGIITILQQEILSVYQYLYSTEIPKDKEIRLCNALTILRSIVSVEEYAHSIIESHILYFLAPLIESNFSNIRKICFAVLFEISQKSIENICTCMLYQGLIISCFSVYGFVDETEKKSILIIFYNSLKAGLGGYVLKYKNPTTNSFLNIRSFLPLREEDRKNNAFNELWNEVISILSREGIYQIMEDGIR